MPREVLGGGSYCFALGHIFFIESVLIDCFSCFSRGFLLDSRESLHYLLGV